MSGEVFVAACTSPPDAPLTERNGCDCAAVHVPSPDVFCQTYFSFNATDSSYPLPHPSPTGLYTLQQITSICSDVIVSGTFFVSAARGPLSLSNPVTGPVVTPNGATATVVVDIPSAAQKYSGIASASCAVPALDPFDLDAYPTGIRLELSDARPVLFAAMTVTLRVRTDTPSLVRAPWFGIATVGPPSANFLQNALNVEHIVRLCSPASDHRPLTGAGLASVMGFFPRSNGTPLWTPPDFAARAPVDWNMDVTTLEISITIPAADAADLAASPALDIGILAAVRSVKANELFISDAKVFITVAGRSRNVSDAGPGGVVPLTAAVSVIAHMPQNHTWARVEIHGGSAVVTTPSVDNSFGLMAPSVAASPSGAPMGGSVLVAPTSWMEPLPTGGGIVPLDDFIGTASRGDRFQDTTPSSYGTQIHLAAPLLCTTFNSTMMRRHNQAPAFFAPLFNVSAPTLRSVVIDSPGAWDTQAAASWSTDQRTSMAWAPGSEVAVLSNVTPGGLYRLRSALLFISLPYERTEADDAAIAALPRSGLMCDPIADYIAVAVPQDSDSSADATSSSASSTSSAPASVPSTSPTASFWSRTHIAVVTAAVLAFAGVAGVIALSVVWCRRRRRPSTADIGATLLGTDGSLETLQPSPGHLQGTHEDPAVVTRKRVLEHVAAAAWGEEADDPCGPVAGGDAHDGTEASEWDAGDAATSVSHQAVSVVAARLREREARLGAASDAALPPPPPAIPGYTWVVVPVEGGGGSQAVAYYPRPDAAADTDERPLLGAAHGGPPESCYETTVSADFKSRTTCITRSDVSRAVAARATAAVSPVDLQPTLFPRDEDDYETTVSADYHSRAGATESTFL